MEQPVVLPPPVTVVIDAAALAQIMAAALAALLDERPSLWRDARAAPAGNSLPSKPSFWSHARQLDVLLSGLAVVIVLVILAAWLA
jgi:hypothetical protein